MKGTAGFYAISVLLMESFSSLAVHKKQKNLLHSSTKLKEAVNYSVNQELYLRCFLQDPQLPLNNNNAERSIKSFV